MVAGLFAAVSSCFSPASPHDEPAVARCQRRSRWLVPVSILPSCLLQKHPNAGGLAAFELLCENDTLFKAAGGVPPAHPKEKARPAHGEALQELLLAKLEKSEAYGRDPSLALDCTFRSVSRQANTPALQDIGTIEARFFSGGFSSGTDWLFSANALRNIRFAEVERPARYVFVVFDPGELMVSTLRAHQKFEWSDARIFEIKFPDGTRRLDRAAAVRPN